MSIAAIRRTAGIVLAAALLAASPGPALGQSQSDLRRETQRLQTEVDDLRRELQALKEELARLRAENARLHDQLAVRAAVPPPSPTTAPAAPAQPVTIDESLPGASPRALLAALRASYAEAMAETAIGEDPDTPERIAYLRRLDRWALRVNRKHKTPIEWQVAIVAPPVRVGRGFTMRLRAVDPGTSVTLGDPFDAFLDGAAANRLQELERRRGLDATLVLKGVLVPRVHVNEDRMTEGAFDNPRFIGPFAEFGFTVSANTLLPPPRERDRRKPAAETAPDAG